MAAHRYWRASSFDTDGVALALSELQLHNAVGLRVDASASLAANIAPTSGALANLQDGSAVTATRWEARRGVVLVWDFGAGGEVDITEVRIGAAATGASEFPAFFGLAWSDDGITFSALVTVMAVHPGVAQVAVAAVGWLPSDSMVALQLGFRGANGSTAFSDDVPGNVWSAVGGAAIKTDQFKWGGSAAYFNGVDASLSLPSKPRLDFVGGDFIIECWFRVEAFTNNFGTLLANGVSSFLSVSRYLMVFGDNAPATNQRRKIAFGGADSGFANPLLLSSTVLSPGVWYRVKVVRAGTRFELYLNDVLEATGIDARVVDMGNSGTRVGTNLWDGANGFFRGHIGELRVVSGASEQGVLPQAVRHPIPSKRMPTRTTAPGRFDTGLTVVRPFGTRRVDPRKLRGDYYTGVLGKGIGRVRGKTLDHVDPANVPYRARVRLIREIDGMPMREAWAAVDGGYDFQYVDELQVYTVLAYYVNNAKRAVVTDGLSLANGKVELMP